MGYVLARIQVLKNKKPENAIVYVLGVKEITIPLESLAEYGYTIVCPFEQSGSSYMILQHDNKEE